MGQGTLELRTLPDLEVRGRLPQEDGEPVFQSGPATLNGREISLGGGHRETGLLKREIARPARIASRLDEGQHLFL